MKLTRTSFYLLSFTWGLPLTLWGCLVALVLLLRGEKPQRFGWAWYFRAGSSHWGGMEGGPFFVRDRSADEAINYHEYGHAIQNCLFGPLMIPLISLPSAIRYQYRRRRQRRGRRLPAAYDAIWFEGQASRLGRRYMPPR